MIGRSGERGSGISMLAARHDDDDDLLNLLHLLNLLNLLERFVIAFVPLPKTIVILYCF